ncbi:MAG: hypothetical protein HOW73_18195 [Polyangiaceae bacterium]|nr:hypothetical protein [Polyangiaceae bacterium]
MSFSRDERRTYLLGWNALEEWPTRDQSAQKLRHRTLVPIRWTCGRTKGILPGDRVFVVHQGTNSAGIVASGWVSRGTFNTGERTDPSSRITPLVIEFSPDVLLSSAEPALDVQGLDDAAVRAVNWSRVSSGVGISKASAEALETLWSAHEHALHLTRDRGSPQGTLRVLNSGADEDWHTLRASARDGEQASWFAPKGTEIGDDVLFFIQGRGIVAKGRACSTATYKGDDPRASAEIGDIELVEPALTPADLQQALPDWKWLTYPRSYTSPNPDIATRLWELCSDRNPDAAPAHEGAEEGEFVTVLHRRRERDRGIVAAKKAEALRATGSLHCEVCQFDFEQVYGERGEDCCEVHHLDPLGARDGSRRTKLEDLAILCANCHRMVHRAPLLTPAELRSELARRHRVRVDGAAEEAAS